MIPVYLTFEGLYSYQTRQEIDFEQLTAAGLFGVFGAVGSGKSSILEAIVFALYGETERMNSRENRAYNMMNLKVDRSFIAFEFYNYENKKFKITREFRRNSKKFDDIRNMGAVLYEENAGQWIPLEHTNSEMITGFSYQNFKRTTIIPQGKFKEFLELGAADRTQMMKEIFGLQQYDLQYKAVGLLGENQSKIDHLQGKLSGYELISEELLADKKNVLKMESATFERLEKSHQQLAEQYQLFLKAIAENKLLQKEIKKWEEMKIEQEKFKKLTHEIEQYELFQQNFAHLLEDQKILLNEKKALEELLQKRRKEKSELHQEIESLKHQQIRLKPDFDNLDKRKQSVEDWRILIELKTIEKEIQTLKDRMLKGENLINQYQSEQKLQQEQKTTLQKSIEELKNKIMPSDQLVEISNWFQKNKGLQKNWSEVQTKLKEIQQKMDDFSKEFSNLDIVPETFLSTYDQEILAFESQLSELKKNHEHLLLEQKLSEFSHALHDGEACPMCGALEHPNVLSAKDVSKEIEWTIQKIQTFEQTIKDFAEKKSSFERLTSARKIYEEQLIQEKDRADLVKKELNDWKASFVWKEFSADDMDGFELKLKENLALEKERQAKENELKRLEDVQQKTTESLLKCDAHLHQLKLEESGLKERLKTNRSHLKQLKAEDFIELNVEQMTFEKSKLSEENERIEQAYKTNEKLLNEGMLRWTSLETLVKTKEDQLKVQLNKLSALETVLDEQLKKQGLSDLTIVLEILKKNYDVAAIRQQIHQFQLQFYALSETINQRREQLKAWNLSDEEIENRKSIFDLSALELKNSTEKVAALKSDLERLEKQFNEKKEHLKQLSALEQRAESLKVIVQLLKGSGFVQYVSSVYLAELCEQANERFYRMTRNQLRLQLNEKHEFEVVDYLNEGKTRSVKTLSGGQSFQVALSLALALAESVKTHHRSEKNFFFIDEGFGTQDAEAINIVFETLQQLQKENRIVGVISHVAELQERIPLSLRVINEVEKGSRIVRSWD